MGLFSKEPCAICGKPTGVTGDKLKGEGKICLDCSGKISKFTREIFLHYEEYPWTKEDVEFYLKYRQRQRICWKHFCEMDPDLKNKLELLVDNLYFCEEYGLIIVGEDPFSKLTIEDDYDLFFADQIAGFDFDFVLHRNSETKGALYLNILINMGRYVNIPFLLTKDQKAEIGMKSKNEISIWNGYQTYWIEKTAKIEARIKRFRKVAYLRTPDDILDKNGADNHMEEKSRGLFMLDKKQFYDVNYLGRIRNGLIQVYGSKAEIDQAYDYLMKQIGAMSADENTGEMISGVCSGCGHQNPYGARFCENCGAILK